MKKKICVGLKAMSFLLSILAVWCYCVEAFAETGKISRYKIDFIYQQIGYQILSETEYTVAVCQPYDIDSGRMYAGTEIPYWSEVGENGFLFSFGLRGSIVEIPQTVYDEKGAAYTVTDLANGAINYESIDALILPNSLVNINSGIVNLPITSLYLPADLKTLSGIYLCPDLKSLYIPWGVESVEKGALRSCGFEMMFFPPNVKSLGAYVLSGSKDLKTTSLSRIETMGNDCFRKCSSFSWANLPETLKSMGDGCFNDCPELRRVSLPWSEIRMNDCFNGCPAVECIEILAAEPYPFPENCFNDVDRANCDLLVPEESLEKYMQADGWKDFFRINGVLTGNVSVKSVKKDTGFVATGGEGTLKIYNADGIALDIVSMDGKKMAIVAKTGSVELSIPAGVYIVSSGSGSTKVRVL